MWTFILSAIVILLLSAGPISIRAQAKVNKNATEDDGFTKSVIEFAQAAIPLIHYGAKTMFRPAVDDEISSQLKGHIEEALIPFKDKMNRTDDRIAVNAEKLSDIQTIALNMSASVILIGENNRQMDNKITDIQSDMKQLKSDMKEVLDWMKKHPVPPSRIPAQQERWRSNHAQ